VKKVRLCRRNEVDMAYGKLFSETMGITTPPTTTPSEPSAAAFPQGQAAFPNASTPKPSAFERFMNEIGGPKPAY
jgi:hypothetical protein